MPLEQRFSSWSFCLVANPKPGILHKLNAITRKNKWRDKMNKKKQGMSELFRCKLNKR